MRDPGERGAHPLGEVERASRPRPRPTSRNITQNASVPRICIRYRFHPLVGRRYRPLSRADGPPASFEVRLRNGTRIHIPAWMTESAASNLDLVDVPRIGVQNLLALASFLDKLSVASVAEANELPTSPFEKEGPRAKTKAARSRSSRRSSSHPPTVAEDDATAARRSHRRSAPADSCQDSTSGGE